MLLFFFSSRRRHTRCSRDWSSDVCSSDLHLNFQLNSIEGVRDGTFVMPEEADGTVARLTAFVVAPGLATETIMTALRQRIDAAFLPRPLCFVKSLPRNETGKLPRMALDDLVARLAAKAG